MQGINTKNERRAKFRFDIQREIRYKLAENGVVVAAGTGQTLNICSAGVAFTSEQALTPGGFVELSISWPVLLDDSCPMRLIALGRLLRCNGPTSICTIDKYEFRTQARTFQSPASINSNAMLQRWVDGIRKETSKTAGLRN
jgi:hypothetical protein